MVKYFKILFLVLPLVIAGCWKNAGNSSERAVARVQGEYLYESELDEVIPPGTTVKDSLALVENYINNWISDKIILHKAKKNLLDNEIQFEKQLEEYKNSLIVYAYESKLVKQNLDTIVTQQDLETYYNAHQQNFQLRDNIVKAYYARFDKENEYLKKIRNFFYSDNEEARDSLEKYAEEYSDLYFMNDETWILFEDFMKHVPINTYNQEAYLQNHRKIQTEDDDFIYFVNFVDFKVKDGISPLSFEEKKIRQIILNMRKHTIIKGMHDEVFNYALENNEFEIY